MNTAAGKFAGTRILALSIVAPLLIPATSFPSHAQAPAAGVKKRAPTASSAAPAKKTGQAAKKSPAKTASEMMGEKYLAQLSRALRDDPNATTYGALSAFAAKNAKNEFGPRAALALGYYDFSQEKYDLAMGWFRKSLADKLLREYALYWQAQAMLALGQKQGALEQWESFRREFPGSVMTEQVIAFLSETALSLGKVEDAQAALDGYANTASKPGLLLLRAQTREKLAQLKGEQPVSAAADYLDVYYRFPLNEEAGAARIKIPSLQATLGEAFPGTPVQTQLARAEAFFLAKRWPEARSEFEALLPKLSGTDHERADLRIAQCDVQTKGHPERLSEVSLTDPELDAERLYYISQEHRSQKLEARMLDEIEDMARRFPQSPWVEEGLFAAGNFYWVNLDRDHATEFYTRLVAAFPDGKDAPSAAWRVAWSAYLGRKPEAVDLVEAYIRQYPSSSYIQDALYWLGRSSERSGNMEQARGFYSSDVKRFPLTYFGAKAADRLRPAPDGIGASPVNVPEVVAIIPPAPPLASMDIPLSAEIQQRQQRARALSVIAFDASAELEYRAAYALARSPRLLVDAATAAVAAGRYSAGIVTMRQAFPQLEARRISDIPDEAWHTAFPLPYESSLRGAALGSNVDPMLVAGLVRQESAFESNAESRAGAVGLMQVLPKTAAKLARQLKVKFARKRLSDPGYNLQLGSRYLADLIQAFGTREAALAAYNAGEDRVEKWTAGQNYLETAEFVESIPFTETREYVQIVIRNADVYRQVYDATGADVAARPAKTRPVVAQADRPAGQEGKK